MMTLDRALSPEEIGWVRQAQQGDATAFEKLSQLYLDGLWRYCTRLVSQVQDAEDIAQQTLWQAYRALPTLQDPARFRVWLFKIACNKCRDHLRHRPEVSLSQLSPADDSPAQPFLVHPEPLPDELVERAETQLLLRQAISLLPEPQREVVALRYAADLSFAEIGQVLGMKENTVKTHFQRAKVRLRQYLKEQLDL